MSYVIAYVAVLIVFGAIDAAWLSTMGPLLYRPALGAILAPGLRIGPAIAFYLIYPIGVDDRDHGDGDGDGSGRPLRGQVEDHLRSAGIAPDGGPIRLLCMPRIFGYGLNPLSIYLTALP